MSFSIIAAISSNNVIGKDNKLPWHIPQELEHFYKIIHSKPVVMGHKTYESIGKPIEKSPNIILSRNPSLQIPGCKVTNSIPNTLDSFHENIEIMVIGGGSIYRQFLPLVNKMYLTFIDHDFNGDAYFPKWQKNEWEIIDEYPILTNSFPCRFVTLQKK